MDILIRNSVENYNQLIKDGTESIMDQKTIDDLQEKAEKSAWAFFKQSNSSGTPEEKNSAENSLRFYIQSIASVWKSIAVDLVEQIEKGQPIDCDQDLQTMSKLRQELDKVKRELYGYRNQKKHCEFEEKYIFT